MAIRQPTPTIIGTGSYGPSGEKVHAVLIDLDSSLKPTNTARPICLSQRAIPAKTRIIGTEPPTRDTVTCDQCLKFRCVR
jgi:hypothetical protein